MPNKRFLTEKDIEYLEERLKGVFVTKEEFEEYRSLLFNKLDEILKEVLTGRQEQTVIAHRVGKHTDQLDNHDQRITGLEKVTPL